MADDLIDYAQLAARAMRGIMREALARVEQEGLPGEHHFYISFRTKHPDVRIADFLRHKYPEEMTIVLQHKFWGLAAREDTFDVTLSFSGRHEVLHIPYEAITVFADPSVNFSLQFDGAGDGTVAEGPADSDEDAPPAQADRGEGTSEVIALDAFRKNRT